MARARRAAIPKTARRPTRPRPTPRWLSKATDLDEIGRRRCLMVLSVLAGEQVAGIPGVFLAIPIVALGVVIYRHILEHKGGKGLVAEMIESTTQTNEEAQA